MQAEPARVLKKVLSELHGLYADTLKLTDLAYGYSKDCTWCCYMAEQYYYVLGSSRSYKPVRRIGYVTRCET